MLADFTDIREIPVGCTRGDRLIDRLFTNVSRATTACGTLAPLERSDRRVAYCSFNIQRNEKFVWQTYKYRHFSVEGVLKFKEWIVMHGWEDVLAATDSNTKADLYQKTVVAAINRCFPLKSTRRKNTDLPWMNKHVLALIDTRKKLQIGRRGPDCAMEENEE